MFTTQEGREMFTLGVLISFSAGAIIGGFVWASGGSGLDMLSTISQQFTNKTKTSRQKVEQFSQTPLQPSGCNSIQQGGCSH